MSRGVTSPIKWYGGKTLLASKLVALMPQHTCYVEAFGGSGAVLFEKPPSKVEVYNDLNADVAHFFRVLRDPEQAVELERRLILTPYSRAEYKRCQADYATTTDPVERARKYYVLVRHSVNAVFANGWSYSVTRPNPKYIRNTIDRLPEVINRLRDVFVECLDYRELFQRWDSPETLWYLDPPYSPDTRAHTRRYQHELTRADHHEFLERVNQLKGKAVISGYHNPDYDAALGDWYVEEFEVSSHSTVAKARGKKSRRVEVAWFNYEPPAETLEPDMFDE